MELRVLRYFLAVAEKETISGAAEMLNITQPTLSRQLMELEEELNKKLFVRGNRKMTLTEEGRFLRKRAEEIISLADKTKLEFQIPDELIGGEIFIGAGETDAMRLISKIVKSLQKKHPLIRYNLFSGNADDVTEKLDRGLLDFGILIDPVDVHKYAYIRIPVVDTWGILMKKDCPLANQKSVKPDDLIGLQLMCSRQTILEDTIGNWLGYDLNKLDIVLRYNLIFNASLMVEEGVGYALCIDKLVNTNGRDSLCFLPLEPRLESSLVIVWKKDQVFSRAGEKFLENLREAFSNVDEVS